MLLKIIKLSMGRMRIPKETLVAAVVDFVSGVVSLVVGAGLIFGVYKLAATLGRFYQGLLGEPTAGTPEFGFAIYGACGTLFGFFLGAMALFICMGLGESVRSALKEQKLLAEKFVFEQKGIIMRQEAAAKAPEAGGISVSDDRIGAVSVAKEAVQ